MWQALQACLGRPWSEDGLSCLGVQLSPTQGALWKGMSLGILGIPECWALNVWLFCVSQHGGEVCTKLGGVLARGWRAPQI